MKYDPVGAALRQRQDGGVCLICGGEFVTSQILRRRGGPAPIKCVNAEDGRHGAPRSRKLTMKQRQVKLQAPVDEATS